MRSNSNNKMVIIIRRPPKLSVEIVWNEMVRGESMLKSQNKFCARPNKSTHLLMMLMRVRARVCVAMDDITSCCTETEGVDSPHSTQTVEMTETTVKWKWNHDSSYASICHVSAIFMAAMGRGNQVWWVSMRVHESVTDFDCYYFGSFDNILTTLHLTHTHTNAHASRAPRVPFLGFSNKPTVLTNHNCQIESNRQFSISTCNQSRFDLFGSSFLGMPITRPRLHRIQLQKRVLWWSFHTCSNDKPIDTHWILPIESNEYRQFVCCSCALTIECKQDWF